MSKEEWMNSGAGREAFKDSRSTFFSLWIALELAAASLLSLGEFSASKGMILKRSIAFSLLTIIGGPTTLFPPIPYPVTLLMRS